MTPISIHRNANGIWGILVEIFYGSISKKLFNYTIHVYIRFLKKEHYGNKLWLTRELGRGLTLPGLSNVASNS